MMKNNIVGIYNKTGVKDEYGGWTETPTWEKDIYVDIQPYSTALLLKNYGYNIEVNKRVFIDYFDSSIKIGTILKYMNKYGNEISLEVKAIPWDDGYMEVMGLEV